MDDHKTPATKADIHRLETRMEAKLDKKFDALQKSIDQVLEVVVNVDNRLSESVINHERRITRLESHVGITA